MLLAAACGAVLFSLTATALVSRLLPKDLILTQPIPFRLPPGTTFQPDQWAAFARDQINCTLPALAQKHTPDLQNALSFDSSSQTPHLFIRLRTKPSSETLLGFGKLIQTYTEQRSLLEKASPPNDRLTPDPYQKYLLEQLEKLTNQQDQTRQDLDALTQHRNQISALLITQQKWLTDQQPDPNPGPNQPNPYPADFENFIADQIRDTCSNDETLRQLHDSLRDSREKMAELDRRAAAAPNTAALAEIDLDRNTLTLSLQNLSQTIRQRQNFLAEQIRQTLWPAWQQQLRSESEQARLELVACSLKKDTLTQQLNAIQAQLDQTKKELEQCRQQQQKLASSSLPPPAFQPHLVLPLPNNSERTVWSRAHYWLVLLAALLGGWLGCIVAPLFSRRPHPAETIPADQTETDLLLGPTPPAPAEPDQPDQIKENLPEAYQSEIRSPQDTAACQPQSRRPQDPDQPDQPEPQPDYLAVIDLSRPASADAASYELLIRKIDDLRAHSPCPRIILTAADPADASPRFAVNLGIALARQSFRVLLIDTDPPGSDLAAIFQISGSPGFFEWRRGQAWISQAARKTQLAGLSVMACGTPDADQTSPDLDLNKESHRWNNLTNTFDAVLLFSPAALSAESQTTPPAASRLLDLADGLLCLTRKPQNLPHLHSLASQLTASHKASCLGPILLKD